MKLKKYTSKHIFSLNSLNIYLTFCYYFLSDYRGKSPYAGIFTGRKPQLLAIDSELAKNVFTKDFKNFQSNEIGLLVRKN